MARGVRPNEALAKALERAKAVCVDDFVKSTDLDRKSREVLVEHDFLSPIIRGWYLFTTPEPDETGTSTAWYGSFWKFLKTYLTDRFGKYGYCISPESSVDLYSGETTIPKQVIIYTKSPSNQNINLLHNTSIFLVQDKNFPEMVDRSKGINLFSATHALSRLGAGYFKNNQQNVEIVLHSIPTTELSRSLLEFGTQATASRIAGAYIELGENQKAERLLGDYKAAGVKLTPENPFIRTPILKGLKISSPNAGRIQALWNKMRPQVVEVFKVPPKSENSNTVSVIEKIYSKDAYHSLSIEGYRVTEELIKKIQEGKWDPDVDSQDKEQRDAMAAKGYFNAFQSVIESVQKVTDRRQRTHPGDVFENDLQTWYRELFSPSVRAGIVKPSDLAGYRNGQIFIRGSRHVPPPKESVLDSMEKLFELLKNEDDARVRAVLGHFLFGYIHPYVDGNGRIARFLMNLMLISGNYNWTVIRVEKRSEYMRSLELASSTQDISKFTEVLMSEVCYWFEEIENNIQN